MQHVFTLVVLSLLQLCRAEIPKALPEWYAANLINDAGYQPKPLTEIFTTQETFSSKNPIIITSTSSTSEAGEVLSSSPTSTTRTTELASSPSTEDTTQRVLTSRDSSSTSSQPFREQRQIYQLQVQPIQFLPPLSSFPISTPEQQANPQTTGQPKYFLIYEQAPVSIQQYPQSASPSIPNPQSTTQTTRQVTAEETTPKLAQQTNEFTHEETLSTRISTTQTTILPSSAFTDVSRNVRQGPFIRSTSTLARLVGTWQDPSTSPGPAYSIPAISSTTPSSSTLLPRANITITEKNTRPNITAAPRPKQSKNRISALTIRVKAPRGSITNIKINPTTTTRKPSSRRSQRRKGNNYNNCVDSCKGKKEPICAAPLAVIPIDPNSLKGFPSICHLACHNSFRKNQPFEKIMDGRCSKLRTRIRTFDKNKLNREEMNKAQYTILNNSSETVVLVIQNERSG